MDGPVEGVFEGTPVEDPHPLFLRRSPSKVCCHAHLLIISLSFLSSESESLSLSLSLSRHYQHNTTQHNTSSLKALNDVVSYSSTPETTQASGPCWAFILDPSPVSSSVHTCRTTTKKKILVECLAPNRIFFIDKKSSKPLTKKKAPNRFLILTPKNLYMRMLYYNIIIFDSICQNIS